jgi:hypothetical protein
MVNAPPPRFALAMVDGEGRATRWFRDLVEGLWHRSGGSADKVETAHALAAAAVPRGTQIVAAGGLQYGGALGGNVGLSLYVAVAAAAELPTAKVAEGDWAYALDGRKTGEAPGAGTGVPCWFSAGAWYAADSGAVVGS